MDEVRDDVGEGGVFPVVDSHNSGGRRCDMTGIDLVLTTSAVNGTGLVTRH